MFTLFSRIILSNWRSLILFFIVIVFACTGFVTLRQITTNIDSLVARETRPLFWADLIVSSRGYARGDLLPLVVWYLSWESYVAAERRTFSTTLLDREGKTWVVQVVAYSGSYPQRGILQVQDFCSSTTWGICSEKRKDSERVLPMSEWQKSKDTPLLHLSWTGKQSQVAVTPWLLDRFASWGNILLDGKVLHITEKILESSDLGFSLGTENHLIVLPSDLLSGSLLLSSGSRLTQDLLISFGDERRAGVLWQKLKKILPENLYQVRTAGERSEQNIDVVNTLTDYITLILLLSSIFAFILLRSAHDDFFRSLVRTLRITEMLGLTRRRQQLLLLFLYGIIFPWACIVWLWVAYSILEGIRMIPAASEFVFFWSAVPWILLLLIIIVVMAWFPTWWTLAKDDELHTAEREIQKSRGVLQSTDWYTLQKRYTIWILWFFRKLRDNILRFDILIPSILGLLILFFLFQNLIFILTVWVGAGIFFLIFTYLIRILYNWIFRQSRSLRQKKFSLYDALRALVRPLTPTLPITVSLVSLTVFFFVFASFSLAFRAKLVIDSTNTANIYAINILQKDTESIKKVIGTGALMFDILRARIESINDHSLAEHLGQDRPSPEFTREFNITTSPLENRVLRWKEHIGKWEVSVDDDFARRLGVTLGDTIKFLLSWKEVSLTVANIRESHREGFRPFFYFSFDPVEFKNAPHTYFVAEYTSDIEQWKKGILAASGPHVTFIDIESILKIVRDISTKVLSVISLFFIVVLFFAIGAIIAFFNRMRGVEEMKLRLYTLFGASRRDIRISLWGTRAMIFIVSYLLSLIIGFILSYTLVSVGGFFQFSLRDSTILAGVIGGVYIAMMLWLRR